MAKDSNFTNASCLVGPFIRLNIFFSLSKGYFKAWQWTRKSFLNRLNVVAKPTARGASPPGSDPELSA